MSDVQNLPELTGDQTIQSLMETFNARLVSAESAEHYVGNMTAKVRIGENDYLTLPTVRLTYASHKAELERARATLFASHLLQKGRETARELWKQAAPWEGQEFMAWVRTDIEWKRNKGVTA